MTQAEAILELARRGNPAILPKLRQLLAQAPQIADAYGDLVGLAEKAWMDRIAGGDLRVRESLRVKIEQMRDELAGADAGPVERLLVDRLSISWLAAYQADLADAMVGAAADPRVSAYYARRVEAAHRRVLAAARTLATVRRLIGTVRIEVRHTGEDKTIATARVGGEGARRAVQEATSQAPGAGRLEGLLDPATPREVEITHHAEPSTSAAGRMSGGGTFEPCAVPSPADRMRAAFDAEARIDRELVATTT